MGLGFSNLQYRIIKGKIYPFFLDRRYEAEISAAINIFEENVGKKVSEIPRELIEDLFEDKRVGRGVCLVLEKLYGTEMPEMEDVVRREVISRLRANGIKSLEDFKLAFYSYINEKWGGFVPEKFRNKAVEEFAEKYKLRPFDVEKLLTLGEEESKVVGRPSSKPTVDDVIGIYNFEVIDTLITNGKKVEAIFHVKNLGTVAKRIIREAKRFSVLCDLYLEDGKLRVEFYGPRELFGRATRFGRAISHTFFKTLTLFESLEARLLEFTVEVVLREKTYIFHAKPPLPLVKIPEKYEAKEAMFDSFVEKRFYWAIKSSKPRGWDIIREPEPIILEGMIIVPDFVLVKNGEKIFVEIVGYWRKEYLEKKKKQFEVLKRHGQKIAILVDHKYFDELKGCGLPVFKYKRKQEKVDIPFGKILNFLDTFH